MPAQTRTEQALQAKPKPSWLALLAFDEAWQKTLKAFQAAADRARNHGHPIEAAIYSHVVGRLNNIFSSPPDEITRTGDEVSELLSWLPTKRRNWTAQERKARAFLTIRRQRFDPEDEDRLIRLATQAPGRPAEARRYAVRAWELRLKEAPWPDIEKRFLVHRRNAENPGASIRREVQLLKCVLRRHGVRVSLR